MINLWWCCCKQFCFSVMTNYSCSKTKRSKRIIGFPGSLPFFQWRKEQYSYGTKSPINHHDNRPLFQSDRKGTNLEPKPKYQLLPFFFFFFFLSSFNAPFVSSIIFNFPLQKLIDRHFAEISIDAMERMFTVVIFPLPPELQRSFSNEGC